MSPDDLDPTIPPPHSDPGDEPTARFEPGDEPTMVQPRDIGATRPVRDVPASPAEAEPGQPTGQVFAGRFEVLSVLGEGGMGKVFKVRDRQIEGRTVALKILRPRFSRNARFRELFFQEIRAAQQFVSEHVTQVRDTGQLEDGKLFLTMDYVAGEDLSGLLGREGRITARHALEIARQMLLGLQSGHEQGFVHRDVKPQNVMLAAGVPRTDDNPFGIGVRMLDFGIAGLAADMEEGNAAGTPQYMSPEQAQGQRLDARSDLFAVGICLYEMISGEHLFRGTTLQEITTSVIETDIAPLIKGLEDLPAPLRKLLRRALQKDRNKRFQSAADFIAAIESSSAYKERTGLPGWATSALVLVTLTAGAEGGLLWMQFKDGTNFAKEIEVAKANVTQTLTLRHQGELQALRDELSQATSTIETLRGQVRTEDIGASTSRDYETLYLQAEKLRQENQQILDDNRKIEEELGKVREEIQQLRDQNSRLVAQVQPEAVLARTFDEVASRIETGVGDRALQYLENQMTASNVFAVEGADGREVVLALARAAAFHQNALDASRDGRPGASELLRAKGQLVQVRDNLPSFAVEASSWLDHRLEGDPPPRRLERLNEVLARLEEEIAEADESFASRQDRMLESLLAEPPDADPTRAFEFAREFGPSEIEPLVERFEDHLRATCVRDGRLDVQALAQNGTTRLWGDWLFGEGRGIVTEAASSVRLLDVALHWYTEGELPPEHAGVRLPEPRANTSEPEHDWVSELVLQIRLAQPGSGFPVLPDRTHVYYNVSALSDEVKYFVDTWGQEESSGGVHSWTVERRPYDEVGAKIGRQAQQYRVTQTGGTFNMTGQPILDLHDAGANVLVAAWTELPVTTLPERSWSRALPVDDFVARLEQEPVPCLVFRQGGVELWFAPGYGLVREHRPGVFTNQLVFTNSVF